jgi:hypothetical protein
MYGTDTTTEPIRRPSWGARVKPTTAHQPRNTKRDKRRESAALLALFGDAPQQVNR